MISKKYSALRATVWLATALLGIGPCLNRVKVYKYLLELRTAI